MRGPSRGYGLTVARSSHPFLDQPKALGFVVRKAIADEPDTFLMVDGRFRRVDQPCPLVDRERVEEFRLLHFPPAILQLREHRETPLQGREFTFVRSEVWPRSHRFARCRPHSFKNLLEGGVVVMETIDRAPEALVDDADQSTREEAMQAVSANMFDGDAGGVMEMRVTEGDRLGRIAGVPALIEVAQEFELLRMEMATGRKGVQDGLLVLTGVPGTFRIRVNWGLADLVVQHF